MHNETQVIERGICMSTTVLGKNIKIRAITNNANNFILDNDRIEVDYDSSSDVLYIKCPVKIQYNGLNLWTEWQLVIELNEYSFYSHPYIEVFKAAELNSIPIYQKCNYNIEDVQDALEILKISDKHYELFGINADIYRLMSDPKIGNVISRLIDIENAKQDEPYEYTNLSPEDLFITASILHILPANDDHTVQEIDINHMRSIDSKLADEFLVAISNYVRKRFDPSYESFIDRLKIKIEITS